MLVGQIQDGGFIRAFQFHSVPVNSKITGTLTQYNNPYNRINQVNFSEFCVELLNAKDWAIYQIEAIEKFYLV